MKLLSSAENVNSPIMNFELLPHKGIFILSILAMTGRTLFLTSIKIHPVYKEYNTKTESTPRPRQRYINKISDVYLI